MHMSLSWLPLAPWLWQEVVFATYEGTEWGEGVRLDREDACTGHAGTWRAVRRLVVKIAPSLVYSRSI